MLRVRDPCPARRETPPRARAPGSSTVARRSAATSGGGQGTQGGGEGVGVPQLSCARVRGSSQGSSSAGLSCPQKGMTRTAPLVAFTSSPALPTRSRPASTPAGLTRTTIMTSPGNPLTSTCMRRPRARKQGLPSRAPGGPGNQTVFAGGSPGAMRGLVAGDGAALVHEADAMASQTSETTNRRKRIEHM